MESEETRKEQREQEAKDSSTDSSPSGGAHGPPVTGERGDPKRDPESGVPREEVKPEPGDIKPTDDPSLGKDTHGG